MKIDNSTKSVSIKQFNLNPLVSGGLSKAILCDVMVDTVKIEQNSTMVTFRGFDIPRLTFKFQSWGDKEGIKPSFYFHSFMAIEHTAKNLSKDEIWRQQQLEATIKHFHEVLTERDLNKEETDLLDLGLEEKDAAGLFIPYESQVVVDAWSKFFNNVKLIFDGLGKKGQPIYKLADGNFIPLWIKLLIYGVKGNEINGGSPGMPKFPGQGVIEKYYINVAPSLKIEVAKGESVQARAKEFTKAAPSTAGGVNISESDIPPHMRGISGDVPY